MAVFDPERIAAYRYARQHSRAIQQIVEKVRGKGLANLVVQLRASTVSIPANILEAFGEWRPAKRANYLHIAKGSTLESWAHVDCLIDFGLIKAVDISEVRDLQRQISALLVTMIRNLESEQDRERSA